METIADALRKEERLKKEKEVIALHKMLEQGDTLIKQQDTLIKQQDALIKQQDALIEQEDTMIEQENTMIEQEDTALHEIVQKMLKKKMSFQMIQEITGLSYDKIKRIEADTGNIT